MTFLRKCLEELRASRSESATDVSASLEAAITTRYPGAPGGSAGHRSIVCEPSREPPLFGSGRASTND
jgi:hypothetical protein